MLLSLLTGKTPHYILYGFEKRQPYDVLVPSPVSSSLLYFSYALYFLGCPIWVHILFLGLMP